MSYLISERPEDYEDDEQIVSVLEQLCTGDSFLSAWLKWVSSQNLINISNVDEIYNRLKEFCDYWIKENK